MGKVYIFLLISVSFNSLAHTLIKANALRNTQLGQMNMESLRCAVSNPLLLTGLLSFAISLFFYNQVLAKMDLHIAFPIMNTMVYIAIAIISWTLFKEHIAIRQIFGFAVIILGLWLVSFN